MRTAKMHNALRGSTVGDFWTSVRDTVALVPEARLICLRRGCCWYSSSGRCITCGFHRRPARVSR